MSFNLPEKVDPFIVVDAIVATIAVKEASARWHPGPLNWKKSLIEFGAASALTGLLSFGEGELSIKDFQSNTTAAVSRARS